MDDFRPLIAGVEIVLLRLRIESLALYSRVLVVVLEEH